LAAEYYGFVAKICANYCKKRNYIPSWNTFFEKSSPFVQNFCIYTPSKSVAKCGEFQPKTANPGIVCFEQVIFCDKNVTKPRKKFDKNAKNFDKPIAFWKK
jgi:hypothetical protein